MIFVMSLLLMEMFLKSNNVLYSTIWIDITESLITLGILDCISFITNIQNKEDDYKLDINFKNLTVGSCLRSSLQ